MSTIRAYYNEFDKNAAAWIRELIHAGHITPGDVDERSIEDVHPNDLVGYQRVHFFAGIAGWDHALNLAGWGDKEIWTGSPPCQPFSSAGKGDGFDDPRHLWPHFHRLISALRPARVVGEQVASPDALVWWDAVCTDLEGAGYAGWAADLCSAGIGAPHIRQRLYWVADAKRDDPQRRGHDLGSAASGPQGEAREREREWLRAESGAGMHAGGLADAERHGDRGQAKPADHLGAQADRSPDQRGGCGSASGRLADAEGFGRREECPDAGGGREGGVTQGRASGHGAGGGNFRPGPLDGIRRDADWLHCRDGKWRPVKPGLVPLVDVLPRGVVPSSRIGLAFDADKTAEARAMRLKGYGNAIDPELAAMFLRAVS